MSHSEPGTAQLWVMSKSLEQDVRVTAGRWTVDFHDWSGIRDFISGIFEHQISNSP